MHRGEGKHKTRSTYNPRYLFGPMASQAHKNRWILTHWAEGVSMRRGYVTGRVLDT